MPAPLPISPEELHKLLDDPKALVRRMVLSFALEPPLRIRVGRPTSASKKPRGR